MAHLVLRRNVLDRVEPLSVVYLAVAFAVLTIALGGEWGRIFGGMVGVVEQYDAPIAVQLDFAGDQP